MGLMQKTMRLVDENSVSFQMFLILLFSLHLVQKAKFLYSSNVKNVFRCLVFWIFGGKRAQKPKFVKISEKITS